MKGTTKLERISENKNPTNKKKNQNILLNDIKFTATTLHKLLKNYQTTARIA